MSGLNKNQMRYSPDQMARFIETGSEALDRINHLSLIMQNLRELCGGICSRGVTESAESLEELENLKRKGLLLIDEDANDRSAGQLEYEIVVQHGTSQDAEGQRRVHVSLPDFAGYAEGLMTNVDTVRDLDHESFLSRLQYSRGTRLGSGATVQGVRISARYPRDSRSLPCRAVNSLSGLTGFSASIVGNAAFSQRSVQNTGIPVRLGDLCLNGALIEETDGSPEGLILAINSKRAEHGLRANLVPGGTLVLDCMAGQAIKIEVRSQAAAWVSGFMPGVQLIPHQSCGLLVWIADAEQQLLFDSDKTSMALNGCSASELALSRFGLQDLSCESVSLAQLSCAVLDRLCQLVSTHQKKLRRQLQALLESISSNTNHYVGKCVDSVRQLEQSLCAVPGSS